MPRFARNVLIYLVLEIVALVAFAVYALPRHQPPAEVVIPLCHNQE